MFERIVAAVDADPERAGRVGSAAGELARAFRSHVLVVHVRELERTPAAVGVARAGAVAPVLPGDDDGGGALVDDIVARLSGVGLNVEGRVHPASGSTSRELLDVAAAFDARLIVVGDRGARVSDVVLGGVASRILHQAACPVLLVR